MSGFRRRGCRDRDLSLVLRADFVDSIEDSRSWGFGKGRGEGAAIAL